MEKNKFKSSLAGSGFSFKKKLGQNFISDESLLERIVTGAGVDGSSTVIEIGCGAGTLTRALADRAKKVYGYEIDQTLKPVLARALDGKDNAEIIYKDFLRVRLDELEKTLPPYKVVANLPYYITTPLIMTFVENSKKCLSLTVMVQEEVALRLCAQPDTADYGAITANVALRGECRIIERVGREKFTPSPNVDSAVVHIELCEKRLEVSDTELYKKVVRTAFSSRRKTLENNLVNGFSLTREAARALIEGCNLPASVRGEALSSQDFARLSDALGGQINKK
ncbi:MAG: 16S rRNA (adenine(1518)-N(6)/adenine(1519)-N(6))-dimethyltransferase RsmA [Clostridia bacterium]|nr:16S rRNA (adenine(1518)-N(6)/adenine(1519)-N(6))-dimethyltransferase RsmA [Clostridia bacterium]